MEKKTMVSRIIELQREVSRMLEAREPSPWLDLDLTTAQIRICHLLFCQGPMTPGRVAEALSVPKANITGIIDRLVRTAMVSRTEDPSDRRSYTLHLTDEGREKIARLRDALGSRIDRVLNRLRQEDLEALKNGFEAVLRAIKDGDAVRERAR